MPLKSKRSACRTLPIVANPPLHQSAERMAISLGSVDVRVYTLQKPASAQPAHTLNAIIALKTFTYPSQIRSLAVTDLSPSFLHLALSTSHSSTHAPAHQPSPPQPAPASPPANRSPSSSAASACLRSLPSCSAGLPLGLPRRLRARSGSCEGAVSGRGWWLWCRQCYQVRRGCGLRLWRRVGRCRGCWGWVAGWRTLLVFL